MRCCLSLGRGDGVGRDGVGWTGMNDATALFIYIYRNTGDFVCWPLSYTFIISTH
jgi:hypothetical protein